MCPTAATVSTDGGNASANTYPTCIRCKESITSGHAYELGDDRWHTHCFSCYRCEKPLSCDSDFLVLGTGTLICFDCSDSCKSCGKKIDDLAIILSSSNEAYCSECFKCCKCDEKIKDLRYAKTKRGLFCINCHEKLLAKRKHYEERKRRLKKVLPEIPPTDLPVPLVIPEKSSRRPSSPSRNHQRALSPQSVSQSMVKSNSESVISQYLDDFEDNSTTEGFEPLNENETNDAKESGENVSQTEAKHARNVSIDDILNSTLENDEQDEKHLSNKEKETKVRTLLNKTPLRNHSANESLTKSPISHRRGMVLVPNDSESSDLQEPEEQLSQEYESKSSKDSENYPIGSDCMHTPSAIEVTGPEDEIEYTTEIVPNGEPEPTQEAAGLALNMPSLQVSNASNDEDTLTLGFDLNPLVTIPSSPSHSPSPPIPATALEANKNILRSHTMKTQAKPPSRNANASANGGGRRIGRSLSLKSKSLVHNLKSKTTGILDSRSPSPHMSNSKVTSSPNATSSSFGLSSPTMESDTHSGWGVSSASEKSILTRPIAPSSRHRTTPKGKSDSILQSDKKGKQNSSRNAASETSDHGRSHSNASANSNMAPNVSMYRTPPLENSSVFGRLTNSGPTSHYRTSSWQANTKPVKEEESDLKNNEKHAVVDAEVENDTFLKKELAETELTLRKLKLDLRELESKKWHLTNEVDNLQITKETLLQDIETLKIEKEKPPSPELLNHIAEAQNDKELAKILESSFDSLSPVKQTDTASIARTAAKPKFWKIFSGAKQPVQTQQQQQQFYQQQQPQQQQQHLHHPSGIGNNSSISSSASNVNSNNNTSSKLEISAPVLQNPNEFSDMKLLPISANAHSEMSSQSSPSKADGNLLHGSTLVARCTYEQSKIPMLIMTCARHIESNEDFLKAEGIYRKSGSQLLIEEIEREFADCGTNTSPELLRLIAEDVHAVASVLKRYLRKLPNPVLTFQVYEPLIKIVREDRMMVNFPLRNAGSRNPNSPQYFNALDTIIKILSNLPTEHYDLLKFLGRHINTVTSYCEWNLMTLHNLSLVFAPGLIRDYSGEKDIADMKERNYIVGFIFGNYKDIFGKDV